MEQMPVLLRRRDELKLLSVSSKLKGQLGDVRHGSKVVWAEVPSLDVTDIPTALARTSPGVKRALEAWEALGRVRGADPEVLGQVLLVLLETVPDEREQEIDLPPLRLEQEPERPRATAAHPRAYRGTIHKPPKSTRPELLDLRPYLHAHRHTATLLQALKEHLPDATRWLAQQGYDRDRLVRLEQAVLAGEEPALAYHFGRGKLTMPRHVRTLLSLLPALDECTLETARAWTSMFRRLQLDEHEGRRAAVLRLLQCRRPHVLGWCEAALQLDEPDRTTLLVLLDETGSPPADPDSLPSSLWASLPCSDEPGSLPHRLQFLLRGLSRGLSPSYLEVGLSLSQQLRPGYIFQVPPHDSRVPIETLEQIEQHLEEALSTDWANSSWLVLELWHRCGLLPGLSDLLESLPWTTLSPKTAHALLRHFLDLAYQDLEGEALERKWKAYQRKWPELFELVRSMPEAYGPRCATLLSDWVRYWDEPAELSRNLTRAFRLARALCVEPFSKDSDGSRSFSWYIEQTEDNDFERVLSHDGIEALRKLERACRRENDERLIQLGVGELLKALPAWAIEATLAFPDKFARVARLLGVLPKPICAELLAEMKRHPLFASDLLEGSLERVLERLAPYCKEPVSHPVPHRARMAIEQPTGVLSKERRARALARARERLPLSQLQVIELTIQERLKRGLPVDIRKVSTSNALQLAASIYTNRRSLRRFLAEHFRNGPRPQEQHPANAAWLSKHPKLVVSRWTDGISLERSLPVVGNVRLALENDPLEVLRLGSYVGSCVGVGGLCDYSAAAVALDLNKRVVYARDAKGSVVGRQLLAWSELDRLECYLPYPKSASATLRALFRDYDLAFAEALGVPIAKKEEDDDQVVNIVSTDWWYDGLWDLEA
jgi:hypothetical protein